MCQFAEKQFLDAGSRHDFEFGIGADAGIVTVLITSIGGEFKYDVTNSDTYT